MTPQAHQAFSEAEAAAEVFLSKLKSLREAMGVSDKPKRLGNKAREARQIEIEAKVRSKMHRRSA